MEMDELAKLFEAVKVLPLRPSDFLVFRTSRPLSVEQMGIMHISIEEQTGHSRILILEGGADLDVLRFEDEPAGAAPAPAVEVLPAHRPLSKAPGAL